MLRIKNGEDLQKILSETQDVFLKHALENYSDFMINRYGSCDVLETKEKTRQEEVVIFTEEDTIISEAKHGTVSIRIGTEQYELVNAIKRNYFKENVKNVVATGYTFLLQKPNGYLIKGFSKELNIEYPINESWVRIEELKEENTAC